MKFSTVALTSALAVSAAAETSSFKKQFASLILDLDKQLKAPAKRDAVPLTQKDVAEVILAVDAAVKAQHSKRDVGPLTVGDIKASILAIDEVIKSHYSTKRDVDMEDPFLSARAVSDYVGQAASWAADYVNQNPDALKSFASTAWDYVKNSGVADQALKYGESVLGSVISGGIKYFTDSGSNASASAAPAAAEAATLTVVEVATATATAVAQKRQRIMY